MRLNGYDYAQPGLYFVTKCAKYGEFHFGEMYLDSMVPNAVGEKVIACWKEIPLHYPNVILHSFVLMPNHLHGIIEIATTDVLLNGAGKFYRAYQKLPFQQRQQNRFQHIIPKSLGSIMRGFEIGVTKWCRANTNIKDLWHRNFFDTIIRSEKAYRRITKYILDNPRNWTRDDFFR